MEAHCDATARAAIRRAAQPESWSQYALPPQERLRYGLSRTTFLLKIKLKSAYLTYAGDAECVVWRFH